MKIIVFGATGTVGIEIVKPGLTSGHEVTAFVRNVEKLASLKQENLKIVQGDVLNAVDVKHALQDQEVIFCALGDGSKGKVRAAGTANIIRAMNSSGVQRLICQSTLGAGDSYGSLNFVWKYIMFGVLLRRALADHNRQE